ncbi:MAG: hypothetical protein EOO50_16305 [Flavobacterium sp.]|uniref:hypothetical protein n=1 Tax=Flavobacterium sp. TaxID=239 RepID=UPI00122ACF11|nr:hypothetical protein [Flavobacterium sp.]RZJ64210.1 MAG: hypothetical protein EOO50_16305 [Flavobacterium sp.]
MWLYSVFFLFLLFAFGAMLVTGFAVFLLGQMSNRERLSRIGLRIFVAPIAIVAVVMIVAAVWSFVITDTNREDIAGKYVGIENDSYELTLYENGTFEISHVPEIDLCASGTYRFFDFSQDLQFTCAQTSVQTVIDNGIFDHRIRFMAGDPDSGENVYFEKVTN